MCEEECTRKFTHTHQQERRRSWLSVLQCVWQMKMRPCLCALAPSAVNQHRAHMAKGQPHTQTDTSADITQTLIHIDLSPSRQKRGHIYDESQFKLNCTFVGRCMFPQQMLLIQRKVEGFSRSHEIGCWVVDACMCVSHVLNRWLRWNGWGWVRGNWGKKWLGLPASYYDTKCPLGQ